MKSMLNIFQYVLLHLLSLRGDKVHDNATVFLKKKIHKRI